MTDASRPEANTSVADAGGPSSETRALGFWTCTALVVGNTIGVGIFQMPAALAPYGLNAVPAWGITIVGCVMLAMVFSGLARTYPGDDGPYPYPQPAFASCVSFSVFG